MDSITTSTPSSSHGSAAASVSASARTTVPSIAMPSLGGLDVGGKGPNTESYLSRWARVGASARSFTATNSMAASCSWAARRTLRPTRPKPLMATRTVMSDSFRRGWGAVAAVRLGAPPRLAGHAITAPARSPSVSDPDTAPSDLPMTPPATASQSNWPSLVAQAPGSTRPRVVRPGRSPARRERAIRSSIPSSSVERCSRISPSVRCSISRSQPTRLS